MKKLTHAEILSSLSPPNRIRYVADWIEQNALPEGRFDMRYYCKRRADCGTSGCLAGWTCVLAHGQDFSPYLRNTEWAFEASLILTGSRQCRRLKNLFGAIGLRPTVALSRFRALADSMEAEQ